MAVQQKTPTTHSPSQEPKKTSLASLKEAIIKLRDPHKGCGWHLEQTMKTLTPYTQSEAFELTDAIDSDDKDEILGELGDLLFHVVLYAAHADEKGWFNLEDIAQAADEKARRRHPWVFEDTSQSSFSGEAWEAIKAKERSAVKENKSEKGLLDGLPKAQPALISAHEIHKRANAVGFKWDALDGVLNKIQEELDELKEAMAENHTFEHIEEELGDLLFTVAIIGYYQDINPEIALRLANEKFKKRFKFIEENMKKTKTPLSLENRATMEALWQEAKQQQKLE